MPQSIMSGAPYFDPTPSLVESPTLPYTLFQHEYVIPHTFAAEDVGNQTVVRFNTQQLADMGNSIPTADKVVLLWGASQDCTYGAGGSGFEFYIFANGDFKIWTPDGNPAAGGSWHREIHEIPFYRYSEYPVAYARFMVYGNPYINGAAGESLQANVCLLESNEPGAFGTDYCYTSFRRVLGEGPDFHVCEFPITTYAGYMPPNNSGWVGVPGATITHLVYEPVS